MLRTKMWCHKRNEWEKNRYAILPDGNVVWLEPVLFAPVDMDNHTIARYAFMLDMNGKEIYEYDRVYRKDIDDEDYGTILFLDGAFRIIWDKCIYSDSITAHAGDISVLYSTLEKPEVIQIQPIPQSEVDACDETYDEQMMKQKKAIIGISLGRFSPAIFGAMISSKPLKIDVRYCPNCLREETSTVCELVREGVFCPCRRVQIKNYLPKTIMRCNDVSMQ